MPFYSQSGGGITSINATELSTICTNPNQECTIKDPQYKTIENHNPFTTNQINIQTTIDTFTNYSDITSNSSQTFSLLQNGTLGNIAHFINHGNISGGIEILNTTKVLELGAITNYGTMRGVWTRYHPITITINNFGTITTNQGTYVNTAGNKAAHFAFESKEANLIIENYKITISETQGEFNAFEGYYDKTNNKNSHLIIMYNAHIPTAQNVHFKDGDSKIWLDFGDGFEFGKEYAISKLITDRLGNSVSVLGVDFSRLAVMSDIYYLKPSGDSFIAYRNAGYSAVGSLYKSNIRTMNNFYTISNSMIYPRKSYHSQNLGNPSLRADSQNLHSNPNISSLRASEYERGNPHFNNITDSTLDSAIPLKSYESFAYRSEAQNRRIQRQNKRNYSRQPRNLSQNQRTSQNQPHNLNNYYFILTPFVNYNSFAQSGNYNLSGFDYGFLTAFSGKLTQNNSLGAHFMMSYGNLGDSKDKDFNITNLNLNVGVNYKLDLIWDMFIKARGDFYYFLNQVSSASVAKTNADNLGFGLSVSYGKDFDFKQGGVLGIEVGIDYKALRTNDVSVKSALDNANMQDYKKSLVNLIYADLGANYAKYFGGFGINVGLGFRANLAPKLAKTQLIIANNTLNVLIDNDKFLGYANAGISYMINHKNFDMEFSIVYYGSFGDRGISNGGGVEWRVEF